MANNYFRFKQFTVHQQKAALKVSTDSCVFGAWVSAYLSTANRQLSTVNGQPSTILDIGTGTGLLMLMLAQKTTAGIEGVEIDKPSYEQAKENIEQSPWKERLSLFHADIKTIQRPHKYELIISNPPFYEGDLKSANTQKNIAKHDSGLTLEELMEVVSKNLSEEGSFAVLVPYHRTEELLDKAAKNNLYAKHWLKLKQTPRHPHFRSILLFTPEQTNTITEELVIKNEQDQYTPAFINLLEDYYLHL